MLLGADDVPVGVAKRLRQQGQAYIDSGGNAWMDLPGFHIDIQGRKPEVVPVAGADRPSRAFGIAGLRVVFVLLIAPRTVGAPLRTIAQERFWDPRCAGFPTQHVPPLMVLADLSDSDDPRLSEAAREYQDLHED